MNIHSYVVIVYDILPHEIVNVEIVTKDVMNFIPYHIFMIPMYNNNNKVKEEYSNGIQIYALHFCVYVSIKLQSMCHCLC